MTHRTLSSAAILFTAAANLALAQQSNNTRWVATWASAQQQPRGGGPPRGAAPAGQGGRGGAGAPAAAAPTAPAGGGSATAAAPANPPAPPRAPVFAGTFNNQTARMVLHTSIGGNRVRVHLSNTFGATPVTIGAAHIALRSQDSAIVAGSDHPLMFNGAASVTIPVGAEMLSDPVNLNVPALSDVAISVYAPGETGPASTHSLGLHTTYISDTGDFTAASEFTDAKTSQSWYWVSALDVQASPSASAIVAFGDSITDGATSTPNTDRSWPSILAQRLQANPATASIAVINQGISGNRVLGDGAGVSALARFDRDVLAPSGVKWVMIMESINDIGLGARQGTVTADALIGGLHQMIERAHAHGIKVIGCTLTPYVGASYASDEGEAMREAINTDIRTNKLWDASVDFDKATRDPDNPKQFRMGFNNTDHLHPNDAGYKAMAESIDLSIFK